jgi:hypothetical protein
VRYPTPATLARALNPYFTSRRDASALLPGSYAALFERAPRLLATLTRAEQACSACTQALCRSLLFRGDEAVRMKYGLPLITLYLTERCNSRCVTCDYWRHGRRDVTLESVRRLLPELESLGTRTALISGG